MEGGGAGRAGSAYLQFSDDDATAESTACLVSCCGEVIYRLSPENGNPMGMKPMDVPGVGSGKSASAHVSAQVSENEIVVGTPRWTPFVFDVVRGTSTATLSVAHTDCVGAIAFDPESQLLVTAGGDSKLVVWFREESLWGSSSFAVKCQMEGHRKWISDLDAHLGGLNLVVSASGDDTARVWDISRQECVAVLRGHSDSVSALCHDSDKQIQFTGSFDKRVFCWDFRTKNQKVATLGPFPDCVGALCFRRSVQQSKFQLVVLCDGGFLQVIDARMMRDLQSSSDDSSSQILGVSKWRGGHRGRVCGGDSLCDVADRDYFVTCGGRHHKHIKAWRENGDCVWDWKCPLRKNRPLGIHPFIGTPTHSIREEEVESRYKFLVGFCRCSLEIVIVPVGKKITTWKWVIS